MLLAACTQYYSFTSSKQMLAQSQVIMQSQQSSSPCFCQLWCCCCCCCCRFALMAAVYKPLNPVKERQPSRIDIYPGLSGPLPVGSSERDSYVTKAPDSRMLQIMYDQGRNDAAAYVRATMPSKAGSVSSALQATAKDVNSIPVPSAIEGAINGLLTAAGNPLKTLVNAGTNSVTTLGNQVGK